MPPYRAKKRLGQHFLKSEHIVKKILDVIDPQRGQTIIEIGAGRGAFTLPLAQSGAKVIAVEFDRDFAGYLGKLLKKYDNVSIINQDFLKFEPDSVGLSRFTLVGNMPFNITSPVIDWATRHQPVIDSACLMVQKEMAERLSAIPKTKNWSPLSIFTQLHFDVTYCFDVAPEHFRPSPKVTSAVIKLTPKKKVHVKHWGLFEKVVRVSFQKRRKLLVNNLVPDIIPHPQTAREILCELGLPENCRAEQLTTTQFLTLTEHLTACKIL